MTDRTNPLSDGDKVRMVLGAMLALFVIGTISTDMFNRAAREAAIERSYSEARERQLAPSVRAVCAKNSGASRNSSGGGGGGAGCIQ